MTRRLLRAGLVVAMVGPVGGCFLDNDVSDGQCTPSAPDISLNDDCPYQNGRGPQLPAAACEPRQAEAGTAATWTDVLAIFLDQSRGNCSAGGCHGVEDKAAVGIFLPANDPQAFYDALVNTTGSVGRPYVNPKDPLSSWIHCNVRGTAGGGLPMPKPAGLISQADADIVEDWVLGGAAGP